MKKTYLGLGSNLGNREKNLIEAIYLIRARFKIVDYSSIYQSSPVGYENQASFLNMVVEVDIDGVTPQDLLSFVKDTEVQLGRRETFRWGPRVIDIDILFIEDLWMRSAELTIPHKELFNRKFVLAPLSEITPFLEFNDEIYRMKDYLRREPASSQHVSLYKKKKELLIHDGHF
jgi:2-amino-4-hydroxy-6-hydroxymethyldihydropteridine diphosphokinase